MRHLISICLILMIPLMLASETQHRYKVAVDVVGKNETLTNLMTSHLKRELRALGDVDITQSGDWVYRIEVTYLEVKTKAGSNTGYVSIAVVVCVRVPDAFLKVKDMPPVVYANTIYSASLYWHSEKLQEMCITLVGAFNDVYLEHQRDLLPP